MHQEDDGKEAIEDRMRNYHLYRVFIKGGRMEDIIRAIKGIPLDHLDKNK